jgi:hypothetical protein
MDRITPVSTLDRALLVLALVSGVLACSNGSSMTSDAGMPSDGPLDRENKPFLTALSVSTSPGADAGTAIITLVPPFSSDVHDYYVRCGAGLNPVDVSVTASAGATSSLLLPDASRPSPQQTLTLSVSEDQAIVATASAGKATTEYWVRCLPHDFPQMLMTTHPDAGTPPPGYYVLGANDLLPNLRWGYAIVLDGHGVPVWYTHGQKRGSRDWDVDSLLPGTVSFFAQFGHPVEVHQLSPLKTTYAAPMNTSLDSHELRRLNNGHYLVLADPTTTGVDLTGVHVGLPDGGVESFGKGSSISECNLVEFDPSTGNVVWTWVSTQHLDPAKDTTAPEVATQPGDAGPLVEPFHCNAIDVDPSNGNLLVSARDMDSIFYIDRSTDKILWKMGGKSYTKDNATYVKVNDPFFRQHDARLLPGWSPTCAGGKGQISLFDDHSDVPGSARGMIFDVVVGADAGASGDCGTKGPGTPGATVAWKYQGLTRSSGQGSFRVSADGSRVIGWGMNGTRGLVFTEVNEAGDDLVDFDFTDGNVSYRVIKVPLKAFDLEVMRRTAGASSAP